MKRPSYAQMGLYSKEVVDMICKSACSMSYREVQRLLEKTLDIEISAQSVWNIVQAEGRRYERELNEVITGKKTICKKRQSKYLFEEVDGIYLRSQDKNNKQSSFEVKASTAYVGREKGKLKGAFYYVSTEGAEVFQEKRTALLDDIYNTSINAKRRFLNTDGAYWCKNVYYPCVHVLDRYHINSNIITRVRNATQRKYIFHYLKQEDYDMLFSYLREIIQEENNKKQRKELLALYTYLFDNRYSLDDYRKYLDQEDRETYKHMGVQEGFNYVLVAKRMKRKRMRWSKAGANSLLQVITWQRNAMSDDFCFKRKR